MSVFKCLFSHHNLCKEVQIHKYEKPIRLKATVQGSEACDQLSVQKITDDL